ncbi:MAG: hypothetical protein Kow0098_19600 [Ignavibacteriaceae bacterium]
MFKINKVHMKVKGNRQIKLMNAGRKHILTSFRIFQIIFSSAFLIFLLTLLITFTKINAFAQSGQRHFKPLSNQEGVSLNMTYSILQDSKGFLWFGTMYGLVKYDGKNFTVFRHNPQDPNSISFDDIISLFEDSKGNLWIGTWGGGLNMFIPDSAKFKRFIHSPDQFNTINSNIVWAINEDKKGNIWIGTESGGLNILNPVSGQFRYFRADTSGDFNLRSEFITSIVRDKNGTMWVGTGNGLHRFVPDKNGFEVYSHDPRNPASISSDYVTTLYVDNNNDLWIGTNNGFNKFERLTGTFTSYYHNRFRINTLSSNFIHSITGTRDGSLWIGTSSGLDQLTPAGEFIRHANSSILTGGSGVVSLLTDASDIVWAAEYNIGVTRFIDSYKKFNSFSHIPGNYRSISPGAVNSVSEDSSGNIWLVTRAGFLNRYEPERSLFYPANVRVPDRKEAFSLNSVETDLNGTLLLGSNAGLLIYNPFTSSTRKLRIQLPTESLPENLIILSTMVDKSGALWIGTYGYGLIHLDKTRKKFSYFSFQNGKLPNGASNYILTFYQDSKGVIWAGSYGGLLKFNQTDSSFNEYLHHLNDPGTLSNNYVYSVFEDSEGRFWIGTSNGLNLMNRQDGTFRVLSEKDGLPNSVICGILEDNNGNLWISTNKGISKFDPERESFQNFDINDGLQGNIFTPGSRLKDVKGNLYFGGLNGISIFNPDKMLFNRFSPPFYITSVFMRSESEEYKILQPVNSIETDYNYNYIKFTFAALDYSSPEKIKYLYKLEGFDKDWQEAGNNNFAAYTNLPPGEFTFIVKATNGDGIPIEKPVWLTIFISPPFWQTWWFISGVLFLILAGTFLIFRIKSNLKIKRALEIGKIKAEEGERIRKKTAADFHDELGHRLTRITLLTELIRKKLQNTFPEIHPLLEKISDNSIQLYNGTKDFIWAIDPQKDSLYELMIRLKDFGDELFNEAGLHFEVEGLSDEMRNAKLNMDWKRHLTLIFKEGMTNSLKHSHANHVKLNASVTGDEVKILLSDDGEGFEPESTTGGTGLRNIRIRAEKLNGKISFDSEKGGGTTLSFSGKIPFSRN